MGAIFTRHEMALLDDVGYPVLPVTPFEVHISTGKHPYPAGEIHVPVWGPWNWDGPAWVRDCVWGESRDENGRLLPTGCDLYEHTFTDPRDTP